LNLPAPIPLRPARPPERGAARREQQLWRRVLAISSVVAVVGLGCAIFAEVAARTGGWLVRGDGLAYYMTARSLVLDRDTDLSDEYAALDARLPAGSPVLQAVRWSARRNPATGRVELPWPIGTGLVMAPFFALGYGVEKLLAALDGHAPDAYGPVPQLFYGLGALLYGLLGGWATWRCCRRVAGIEVAAIACLGTILGGPLLFYLFLHPAMSHAPSFALVALLAVRWWRHYDALSGPVAEPANVLRPRISRWVAAPTAAPELRAALELGLLFGLLVLVRYQNLTYGLLPLAYLWRVTHQRPARLALRAAALLAAATLAVASLQGLHLLSSGAPAAAPAAATPAPAVEQAIAATPRAPSPAASAATRATATPQPAATQAPVSAASAAPPPAAVPTDFMLAQNRFDLTSPNFARVLLSCQHGAFYWTPVLALGFAGLLWAAWRRAWARLFLAVFLANVYLVGCLAGGTNWSGDHAFGMRYLADCAPLLAAGLAAGLEAALARSTARGPLAGRWTAAMRAAAGFMALLAAGNGLLVLAFSTGRIDREGCVTYPQMGTAIRGLLSGRTAAAATPGASGASGGYAPRFACAPAASASRVASVGSAAPVSPTPPTAPAAGMPLLAGGDR
jgi:hypothetical protein